MQAKQYEEDKKNAALVTSHTAVLQMDFSDNYNCIFSAQNPISTLEPRKDHFIDIGFVVQR